MKRPTGKANCPPAFSNRSGKTESPWVPSETVNKPGSALHHCSEARTIARATLARARIREPESVASRILP